MHGKLKCINQPSIFCLTSLNKACTVHVKLKVSNAYISRNSKRSHHVFLKLSHVPKACNEPENSLP